MKSQTVTNRFKNVDLETGLTVDIDAKYTGYYNFGTAGIDMIYCEIVDNIDGYIMTEEDRIWIETLCEQHWEWMNDECDEEINL